MLFDDVVDRLDLMLLCLPLEEHDGDDAPTKSLIRTQSSTPSIDLFTDDDSQPVNSFFETGESLPDGDLW